MSAPKDSLFDMSSYILFMSIFPISVEQLELLIWTADKLAYLNLLIYISGFVAFCDELVWPTQRPCNVWGGDIVNCERRRRMMQCSKEGHVHDRGMPMPMPMPMPTGRLIKLT